MDPKKLLAVSTLALVVTFCSLSITQSALSLYNDEAQVATVIAATSAVSSQASIFISPSQASDCSKFGQTLKFGDNGQLVLKLKKILTNDGAYSFLASSTPVKIAGINEQNNPNFTEDTARAVVNFQQKHSLPMTGVVGPATVATINAMPCKVVKDIELKTLVDGNTLYAAVKVNIEGGTNPFVYFSCPSGVIIYANDVNKNNLCGAQVPTKKEDKEGNYSQIVNFTNTNKATTTLFVKTYIPNSKKVISDTNTVYLSPFPQVISLASANMIKGDAQVYNGSTARFNITFSVSADAEDIIIPLSSEVIKYKVVDQAKNTNVSNASNTSVVLMGVKGCDENYISNSNQCTILEGNKATLSFDVSYNNSLGNLEKVTRIVRLFMTGINAKKVSDSSVVTVKMNPIEFTTNAIYVMGTNLEK